MWHSKKTSKAERLYERYKRLMHQVAYEILKDHQMAEDAISESFLRIINNLHKIDETNEQKTRSFLVIICRNVAKDLYRRRHKDITASEAPEHLPDDEIRTNPERIIISRENVSRAVDAVNRLDAKYRDVLLLRRIHEYSCREIAHFLGISENAVYKRLERGKKILLKMLEEGGDENA